jgi:hypothetical protein
MCCFLVRVRVPETLPRARKQTESRLQKSLRSLPIWKTQRQRRTRWACTSCRLREAEAGPTGLESPGFSFQDGHPQEWTPS